MIQFVLTYSHNYIRILFFLPFNILLIVYRYIMGVTCGIALGLKLLILGLSIIMLGLDILDVHSIGHQYK